MANRIDATFARLRDEKRAAFVAYLCAGDPSPERTPELVAALEAGGADIVELGLPFSDPLADGLVNQMAADRALKAGTTTQKVLEMIAAIRQRSEIPLVLFTYLNPVYTYGYEAFFRDAAAAGADGILPLDLPPDEAIRNGELSHATGLQQIRLIAPTTPAERIPLLAETAEGFIYYVSREGVTGVQDALATDLDAHVESIRAHTDVPVCVGFGIHTEAQAAAVARGADGVVIGSAIVRMIAEQGKVSDLADRLRDFVAPLAKAIHEARQG